MIQKVSCFRTFHNTINNINKEYNHQNYNSYSYNNNHNSSSNNNNSNNKKSYI